ncbi:kinase-like protein [Hesseltinella vesiculosa]|uniref:Kinase-like protein n=1 Tax=Hesseltinella vesiculosa TaxID=101127 RepID=A0A1X2GGS0_9FUNG|nr:kinase-like protein [Hesseltinella vesiculosa]
METKGPFSPLHDSDPFQSPCSESPSRRPPSPSHVSDRKDLSRHNAAPFQRKRKLSQQPQHSSKYNPIHPTPSTELTSKSSQIFSSSAHTVPDTSLLQHNPKDSDDFYQACRDIVASILMVKEDDAKEALEDQEDSDEEFWKGLNSRTSPAHRLHDTLPPAKPDTLSLVTKPASMSPPLQPPPATLDPPLTTFDDDTDPRFSASPSPSPSPPPLPMTSSLWNRPLSPSLLPSLVRKHAQSQKENVKPPPPPPTLDAKPPRTTHPPQATKQTNHIESSLPRLPHQPQLRGALAAQDANALKPEANIAKAHEKKSIKDVVAKANRKTDKDKPIDHPASKIENAKPSSRRRSSSVSRLQAPPPSSKSSRSRVTRKELKGEVAIAGHTFTILNRINLGGSCTVYRVYHRTTQRLFALKYVQGALVGKSGFESCIREISFLNNLSKRGVKHVPKLYFNDCNDATQDLYMLMEAGAYDLQTSLVQMREAPLRMESIRSYWYQIVRAIEAVHRERVLHRDLKPVNMIFTTRGDIQLIDFGISVRVNEDFGRTAIVSKSIGTPAYMPPEAFVYSSREKRIFQLSLASDIWALGCVLYEMVYGRTPFVTDHEKADPKKICDPNFQVTYPKAVRFEEVKDRPGVYPYEASRYEPDINVTMVDPKLIETMQKCLKRTPGDRPTAQQLLRDLDVERLSMVYA